MKNLIWLLATAFALVATGASAQVAGEKKAGATKWTVGARAGIATVDQLVDPVLTYGVQGEYAIRPDLAAGIGLDYWNETSGVFADQPVTMSDTAVSGYAKLYFPEVSETFVPYIGAGLAIHRYAIRVSERRDTEDPVVARFESKYTDVEGELGLDLMAGAQYKLQNQLNLVAEARYRGMSDQTLELNQLAIIGGLGYAL